MNSENQTPEEQNQSYEIKFSFEAKAKDAKALYEALLLISSSWERHKRIDKQSCILIEKG